MPPPPPPPPTSAGPCPIHFLCVCASCPNHPEIPCPTYPAVLSHPETHCPTTLPHPETQCTWYAETQCTRYSATLSAPNIQPHYVTVCHSAVWLSALNSATLLLLLTQCHRHPFTYLSLWPSALNTRTYLSLWPSVHNRYNTLVHASLCDLMP